VRPTPAVPGGSAVVRPATPRERTGLATFLGYVADLYDVAIENEARAALARAAACRR
jgi:hypothetical protein